MQFAWPNIVLLPGYEASAIKCAEGLGLYGALVLYAATTLVYSVQYTSPISE